MLETIAYVALTGFGAVLAFAGVFFLFVLTISAYALFKAPLMGEDSALPAGAPAIAPARVPPVEALQAQLQQARRALRPHRAAPAR